MNLWHDVPLGDNAPDEINVIIEIPKGSFNKYEIDKKTGSIELDRVNNSTSPYPFDYGFAPQTLWYDDDALDVVVLTTSPLNPGILVCVRPVAVMEMIDDGDSDYKIIGVHVDDKGWERVKDLDDMNSRTLKEYQHFFETYKKKLNGAVVDIHGYKGKADALATIEKSIKLYKEKFKK